MIKKWFKDIVVYFKLLFIQNKDIRRGNLTLTISKDESSSNKGASIIPFDSKTNNIIGGIQQEDQVFKRENDLINEGSWGYGPIVYEADMITIKKESQYGYDNTEHNYEDELLADDVDLMWNIDKSHLKFRKNNTAEYMDGKKEAFDQRWEEIKRQVREDENIDGIIKEN